MDQYNIGDGEMIRLQLRKDYQVKNRNDVFEAANVLSLSQGNWRDIKIVNGVPPVWFWRDCTRIHRISSANYGSRRRNRFANTQRELWRGCKYNDHRQLYFC